MAGFNNSKFGNRNNTAAPAARTAAKDPNKITISGLYEYNKKDGTASKLVMKGKTNKDITIPAGYELKVFVAGGKSKNGKDLPPYQLVAQPARTQARA